MSSRKLKIEVKDGRHFINIENNNNPNHVKKALLIIDVQNDFSFGGAVPINGSLYVINKINQIREFNCFDMIIVGRDWHPRGHISFVGSHTKDKPF